MERLEQLQSFEKIYAPFSGVITARSVDVGQLINAGAGTQTVSPLCDQRPARICQCSPDLLPGSGRRAPQARLTFSEFPGQTFTGKLVRTAQAIDPSSRTLLVEIDVDNRNGKLLPGAYTEVHMNVHKGVAPMIIPVSALIFRNQGLQVGTVVKGPDGDQARLVPVMLGQDNGSTVAGHSWAQDADSQVIQNPPDSLIDKEPVHVVQPRKRPGAAGMKPRYIAGYLSAACRAAALFRRCCAGCTVGPNYKRPAAPTAPAFKETAVPVPPPSPPGGGWKQVSANDSALRRTGGRFIRTRNWIKLEQKVAVSNQTLKASYEEYMQARAAVQYYRSQYYPTVQAGPSASRDRQSHNRPFMFPEARRPTTICFCRARSVGNRTFGAISAERWKRNGLPRKPPRQTWPMST